MPALAFDWIRGDIPVATTLECWNRCLNMLVQCEPTSASASRYLAILRSFSQKFSLPDAHQPHGLERPALGVSAAQGPLTSLGVDRDGNRNAHPNVANTREFHASNDAAQFPFDEGGWSSETWLGFDSQNLPAATDLEGMDYANLIYSPEMYLW